MPLTSRIGNAEISADPNTGLVLGDVNPAATQVGVMTRYRDADDENAADMAAQKADFDPHNHASGSGGRQIGTGPVIAIATNGIDNAALSSSPAAITSAAVQAEAITTPKIADTTVEKEQLGAPRDCQKDAVGNGTTTFHFVDSAIVPLFSIEANHGMQGMNFSVHSVSASQVKVEHEFGALTVQLTCRAYGCTDIT